ncbi:centriolin-like [Poeciliopsis prolifica]|uniref:centriolin-like n=1 Tax=Poeciliopsis prolifica TaxID=188132 RepID=UPI0024143645|nr:centriolin-like [Poeciliopsis prolifica]
MTSSDIEICRIKGHSIPKEGSDPSRGRGEVDNNNKDGVRTERLPLSSRELQRLGSLLEMERAKWFQENQKVLILEKELKDTKAELEKQRNLKKVFINRGKEMKRTLLAVEKFADSEALDPVAIASTLHNEVRHKRKRLLQEDLEQLKVSCIVNEEAFTSEIKAEKERGDALHKELEEMKTRYEELKSKYEADDREEKLQVESKMFYEEKLEQNEKRFEKLRAEKEDLQRQMSQEIDNFRETESLLRSELEQTKDSHQKLMATYERDVSALREQAQIFKQYVDKEVNALSYKLMRDLKIIDELESEKDQLQKQLMAFRQMHSIKKVSYKRRLENLETTLQNTEEVGPPIRKVARLDDSVPENNVTDDMDLDSLIEEMLSEEMEVPDASPEELNDFVEEMLTDSAILYQNHMDVRNFFM